MGADGPLQSLSDLLARLLENLPLHDPPNPHLSANPFYAAQLAIASVIALLSILLFSFLRLRWPAIYYPNFRRLNPPPPSLGDSLFGWLVPLFRIKESQVLELVGLDALMLLRFFKLAGSIFALCSLYGVFVLLALTLSAGNTGTGGTPPLETRLTITALPDTDPRLIAHCFGVYLFTALAFYFFNREYQVFSHLRWSYLKAHQLSPAARSVMMEGIRKSFATPLNIGEVEAVQIHHRAPELNGLLVTRAQLLLKTEKSITRWLRNPWFSDAHSTEDVRTSIERGKLLNLAGKVRPTTRTGLFGILGRKVDAISHHSKALKELDSRILRLRETAAYRSTSLGFVTFSCIRSAHIASQILGDSSPLTLRVSLAPEPRDIFWRNLKLSFPSQIARQIFVWFVMGLVILLYSILLSTISRLSLERITAIHPGFASLKESIGWGILCAFLPPALTIATLAFTPSIFAFLTVVQGARSYSSIERRTVTKHFLFLVVSVLFVYTMAHSYWGEVITKFVAKPYALFEILAETLPNASPNASPFFISYVLVLGVACFPLQLLHPGAVARRVVHWLYCSTPRDFAGLLAPVYIDYGGLYGQPMLVFVAVITYSALSPLILVFGAIYFFTGHLVMKYLLLYVFWRRYESGGRMWPVVFRRLMFGVVLLQVTMACLFSLRSNFHLSGAILPLLVASVLFIRYIGRTYPNGCKFLPAVFLCEEVAPADPEPGSPSHGILRTGTISSWGSLRRGTTLRNVDSLGLDGLADGQPVADGPPSDFLQWPVSPHDAGLYLGRTLYGNPAIFAALPHSGSPTRSRAVAPISPRGIARALAASRPRSTSQAPGAPCELAPHNTPDPISITVEPSA
ncbi:hypothetical protein L0F63_007178 [Massospora cicadina]|nr:hypothetical protein L0F63_007178 [Massospora cicadina]